MAADVDHVQRQRQHFGDHLSNGRGRTLTDVGRSGVDRDATVHVHLDVNRGVGEAVGVPVNRKARAGDEETASDTDALAEGHLSELFIPAAFFLHPTQGLAHPVAGDAESRDGPAVRRQEVGQTQVDGVHGQLLGDVVQAHFDGTAGVDRPVAAHRTAGGLVGPHARTGVVEGTKLVGRGRQHAVVVRGHVPEGSEGASVDQRVNVQSGDATVLVRVEFDFDVGRVTATVDPVHFLTVEGDANRSAALPCKDGRTHFVREGVRLATESSAHEGPDDVDLVHGDVQHRREGAMGVMWHLLRRVELQTSVGVPVRDDGVRFGEAVVHALKAPCASRRRGGMLDLRAVAEGLVDALLHVGASDVVLSAPVDGLIDVLQSLSGVELWLQFLVIDHDGPEGFHGGRFVHGGNARDEIPHVADLLDRHGVLVLGHRKHAEGLRRIVARGDRKDAGHGLGRRGVDGPNAGIVVRRAKNSTDDFVRKADVVAVPRLTGHLGVGVHQGCGLTHCGAGTKAIVHVMPGRLGLVPTDRLGDAVQITGGADRAGTARSGWRKAELSCHALAVFSNLSPGASGLLTVPSRHEQSPRMPWWQLWFFGTRWMRVGMRIGGWRWSLALTAQQGGSGHDGLHDRLVPGAAAEVALNRFVDLGLGWA